MGDLEFDDGIGEIKAPVRTRKLSCSIHKVERSPRPMMVCAVEIRVCVKSQMMGARIELGRMRMSKSRRTARLRTNMSQAAYLVGCSHDVVTMSLSS